jgi:hypothetical protein
VAWLQPPKEVKHVLTITAIDERPVPTAAIKKGA